MAVSVYEPIKGFRKANTLLIETWERRFDKHIVDAPRVMPKDDKIIVRIDRKNRFSPKVEKELKRIYEKVGRKVTFHYSVIYGYWAELE